MKLGLVFCFVMLALSLASAVTIMENENAVVSYDDANYSCGGVHDCFVYFNVTTKGNFSFIGNLTKYAIGEKRIFNTTGLSLVFENKKNRDTNIVSVEEYRRFLRNVEDTNKPIYRTDVNGTVVLEGYNTSWRLVWDWGRVTLASLLLDKDNQKQFRIKVDKPADEEVKWTMNLLGLEIDPLFSVETILADTSLDFRTFQRAYPGGWSYQAKGANGSTFSLGYSTNSYYCDPVGACGNGIISNRTAGYNASNNNWLVVDGKTSSVFYNSTLNWTSNYSAVLGFEGWVIGGTGTACGVGTPNVTFYLQNSTGFFQGASMALPNASNMTMQYSFGQVNVGDNLSIVVSQTNPVVDACPQLRFYVVKQITTPLNYTNSTISYNNTRPSLATNFSLNWIAGVTNLANYTFYFDNGNGTFLPSIPYQFNYANNSLSNITQVINSSSNTLIRWFWIANDTDGNTQASENYSFRSQYLSIASVNSTLSNNNSYAGSSSNVSIRWFASANVSSYIFALDNGNGTFANYSPVVFLGTNNSQSTNEFVTNASLNSIIRFYWWANDSFNNGNTTQVYSFLVIRAPLINFSVYDENSVTSINASLSISNVTPGSTVTMNVNNASFSKSSLPNGNITIVASASGYYQRTFLYFNNISDVSDTIITIYLLNTTPNNSTANTYYAQNSNSLPVPSVQVDLFRSINGVSVYVGSVIGDSSGTITPIILNPFATYLVNAYASGYTAILGQSKSGNACVSGGITTGCVLTFGAQANNTVGFYTSYGSIAYYFSPAGTFIPVNTTVASLQIKNFSLTIGDSQGTIVSWGLNLTLSNGTVISELSSTIATGGSLFNVTNVTVYLSQTSLVAKGWFNRTNGDYQTFSYTYGFYNGVYSGNSVASILTDMSVNSADASMYLVFLLITAAVVATSSLFLGQTAGVFTAMPILIFAGFANLLPWTIIFITCIAVVSIWLGRRPN